MAARSGEEIQAALRQFVARWSGYYGSEKAEAQTCLNELLDCYGVHRVAAGIAFEQHIPGIGFADMLWRGHALVEMKAPSRSQTLREAQPQAERYWRHSAAPDDSYPAVRFVVLCSFDRLLVWDMHRNPSRPAANLTLDELPDKYEALLFLAGTATEPSFVDHHRELTKEAAATVARMYQLLKERAAAPSDEIQRFTMQCVWTLFAEALGMIRGYPLQSLVEVCRKDVSRRSAVEIGFLFRVLNQKGQPPSQGPAGRHPLRRRGAGSRTRPRWTSTATSSTCWRRRRRTTGARSTRRSSAR
jgi:hypothetical protein